MSWIMSHTSSKKPTRYIFYIGAVKIATIQYAWKQWCLECGGEFSNWPTMSEAMKEMHRQLNSPPPEENEL